MENWEKVTNKFLETWLKKDYVVGAFVCGSYVTGRPTKHLDIDLRIIMKDDINWRERGNKIIDGFLIEYFANPIRQEFKMLKLKMRKSEIDQTDIGLI